jgi:ABC-2 type transport system permease protein
MTERANAIDFRQVRALIGAFLAADRRGMLNPMTSTRTGRRFFPAFAGVLMVNIIWSAILLLVFKLVPDFFSALVLAGFASAMLISLQVLLEIDRLIVITEDARIIGALPVNSRTYFTAKVVHYLIFITFSSLSTSFVPALFASTSIPIPLVGPIIVAQFWITALCCSLAAAAFYMIVLKAGFGRKIERILGYVQFVMIFLVYYGMQFMPNFLKAHFEGADLAQSAYWKLLPSYWYASWVKLGLSGWDLTTFLIGLFGIAMIYLLWRIATSSIDLSAAETLNQDTSQETETPKRQVPPAVRALWYRLTNHEDRALAALSWAQFKYDVSFRIAVLSIFPFMAFWVFQAMTDKKGAMSDPFAAAATNESSGFIFLGFMAAFVPSMVQNSIQYSKSWQASWLFYAAPTNYPLLLRATGRQMLVIVGAPIGLVMTGMLTYSYGNFLHALMQTTFILAIAATNMVIMNLMLPALPFSADRARGTTTGRMFLTMIISMVFAMVPISLVSKFGFGGYFGWIVIVGTVLAARAGLNRLAMKKYAEKAQNWEFAG